MASSSSSSILFQILYIGGRGTPFLQSLNICRFSNLQMNLKAAWGPRMQGTRVQASVISPKWANHHHPFPQLPSFSFSSSLSSSLSSLSISSLAAMPKKRVVNAGRMICASAGMDNSRPMTGVVFMPFEEVKQKEELAVPIAPQISLARQGFYDHCEAAINEQINVEYNVSYVYHAMYAYFDRDNVALKGLAKFFQESSEEERGHAEKLMKYQNMRGGRVKLLSVQMPPAEFSHVEKGDALYAMELALSLEKLTNEKLLNLHRVADENNDPQMADFIENEFLREQVAAIKKIADYVTQLRMVGKGHGVWHFDQMLLHEGHGTH